MKEVTYKPEYDQMLVEHMAQGYSFESFGAVIDTCRTTLFEWCDRFPSFKQAKRKGFEKGKRLFEAILLSKVRGEPIKGINLKNSDTACLIFALKTRYRDTYSEKVDLVASGDIKIVIDSDDSNL